MSLTHNTIFSALSASILVSTLAFADVLPQLSEQSPSTTPKTELAANDTQTSSLRCWQYGKLLFEQNGLVDNKLDSRQPMQIFSNDGSADGSAEDRAFYLFEIGSATCLYEKPESTDQPSA